MTPTSARTSFPVCSRRNLMASIGSGRSMGYRSRRIGLIAISHRCDIDPVVLRVRPDPLDENDLTLIINRDDEPIVVPLNIKNHAIRPHDAGIRVLRSNLGWTLPIRPLDLMKPGVETGLDCLVILTAFERL